MSKGFFLELGDIIKINAPANEELNQQIFFIDYLDDNLIRLLQVDTLQSHILNISQSHLSDESIQSIEVLSKAGEKGYARLNNLIPETWVQIDIGGDIPAIIIGKITNLDEDMIQVQEYRSDKIIFIDFGYKGIPLHIPGLKIKIRNTPRDITPQEKPEKEESPEESPEELEHVSVDDIEDVSVQDKLTEEDLEEILLITEDDEDVFEVEQIITVPEEKRRYDIDTQMTNMLDDRLSVIPNKFRTKEVINGLHVEIERFQQLRMMYSILDENQIPGKPLRHGERHKPLAKKLYKMEEPVYWIIPSIQNKKKLYNIDPIESDSVNDATFLDTTSSVLREIDIYEQYVNNNGSGERNKYEKLLQDLNPEYTPFQQTDELNSILITQKVGGNMAVIVNNDSDFKSSVSSSAAGPPASRGQKKEFPLGHIRDKQYYMDRHVNGLTHLNIKDIKNIHATTKVIPLTANDTMNINGFVFCPYPVMNYSNIYLPNTSILQRCDLHHILFNYWSLLHSNVVSSYSPITQTPLVQINSNFQYEDDTLLHQFMELTLPMDELDIIDNAEGRKQRYDAFINAIIPTTNTLFELVKDNIKLKTSLVHILKYLEPFAIYHEDIVYRQYAKIVAFIKKNILLLKKKYYSNAKSSSRYSKLYMLKKTGKSKFLTYITHQISELYNLREEVNAFENVMSQINKIDNGRFLLTTLSIADIDLHSAINMEEEAEKIYSKINADIEKNEDENECKKFVLAKMYDNLDQLSIDDNNQDVFFDRRYDPTRYSILDEFKDQQSTLSESEFLRFLVTHLSTNVGMTEENAIREANAMVTGKRVVAEGDYAIIEDDDSVIHYYRRQKNKWVTDKTVEGNALDETFCNLQNKCLKIKDDCGDVKLNKSIINKDLLKQIGDQFDSEYTISKDELNTKLQNDLQFHEQRIPLLRDLNEALIMKYDRYKISVIEQTFEERNQSTIQTRLRDAILAQNDFVKKQNTIVKFVDIYCKTDESVPHWFLCKDTDMKLLPTFYKDLADAFHKGQYQQKLIEIKREKGEISDDGAMWIDVNTGYPIAAIDYDMDEGYTEEGFKQVSRDIIEESLGEKVIKQTIKIKKIFINQETKSIYNIVNAMGEFIGIDMESEFDYISKQVMIHLGNPAILPTKKEYEAHVKLQKQRKSKKRFQKYELFRNSLLLLFTLGYFLIALQTRIPSPSTKVRFPGCIRSFNGYPCDGDVDFSALKYIVCIVKKVSKRIDIWKVLSKKTEDWIERNLKARIKMIMNSDKTIKQRIKEKKTYLQSHPDKEEIPYVHDITRWSSFLPPLGLSKIKKQRGLGSAFRKQLFTYMRNGDDAQFNHISILLGKIIYLSLLIQSFVQDILHTEDALLKNSAGQPFLENYCCNEGEKNTLLFLIDKKNAITTTNKEIYKLSTTYSLIQKLSKAGMLYDNYDTHIPYPKEVYDFDERTIYRAFIVYCKIGSLIPSHPSLQSVCLETKSEISINDTIDEKIIKLKEEGKFFTVKSLTNLLEVVGRENYIDIDMTRTVLGRMAQLRHVLSPDVLQEDDESEFQELIQLLIANNDSYESVENADDFASGPASTLRDFVNEKTNEKRTQVIEFLGFFGHLRDTQMRQITQFLNNIKTWKARGENLYMKRKDETLYYSGNFLKSIIIDICELYPLMVTNKVNYSTKIHKHWGLSARHENQIRGYVNEEFIIFKPFYNNKRLTDFLDHIKGETLNMRILMKHIPFMADLNNQNAIFNGEIYAEVMEYFFFSVLCKYIESGSQMNIKTQGESADEEGCAWGDDQTINETICNLLLVYIDLFENKKKLLNKNNTDIAEKILRQKEREKDKMTARLSAQSIEERDVGRELQTHKLGVWSKGLKASLFKYSPEEWDIEFAEIERDVETENRLNQNREGDSIPRGILKMDMETREDINTRLDGENYNISSVPSSDDGDGERDF